MKVGELITGDWLQHVNGKFYQVTRIDALSDGNIHFACGTPHLWEYNNKFEPIPITPEILQKNGFEKEGRLYFCSNEDFYLGYWIDDRVFEVQNHHELNEVSITCDCVHHIQHAIMLCKVDKNIIV